jgi:hypothetical protein
MAVINIDKHRHIGFVAVTVITTKNTVFQVVMSCRRA